MLAGTPDRAISLTAKSLYRWIYSAADVVRGAGEDTEAGLKTPHETRPPRRNRKKIQ